MNFSQTLSLLLLAGAANSVDGFRDQTQKKTTVRRRLDKNGAQNWYEASHTEKICTVNHDLAQSTQELNVHVQAFPGDAKGLFDIKVCDAPYAPADPTKCVTTSGWCIDHDRPINTGNWQMDVFSAFDPDIHTDAIDKDQYLPNLAWLINNVNVNDYWPASNGCAGGTINWKTLQGAVWYLIDDQTNHHWWYKQGRLECVSIAIAEKAKIEGAGYEPDCHDPNEQVPLVFVVDDANGEIHNQVIISETSLHSIEGMCDCQDPQTFEPTKAPTNPPTAAPVTPEPREFTDPPTPKTAAPTPETTPASGSGDPHFKTWFGEKFDYHGECDLVLADNPLFANGKGLKVHIRTTQVKYFSYIEKIALQIGNDVLEFDNDVETFLINGEPVEENRKHHKTMFAGYVVRRDKKAISVRLHEEGKAKIDFHTRKNGFPAVILDGGETDIFRGSLGMLGQWETGRKIARDGEHEHEDATAFALEWQVRDTEEMLFKENRYPQYPTQCTPPKEIPGGRLGMERARKEAEEACAHWEHDQEDCVFDVIATRDVLVAAEGHIVHVA